MKTAEQTRRAMAQRQANERAAAAGKPLPHPNPWDSLHAKLPRDATAAERRRWAYDLAKRSAPPRR